MLPPLVSSRRKSNKTPSNLIANACFFRPGEMDVAISSPVVPFGNDSLLPSGNIISIMIIAPQFCRETYVYCFLIFNATGDLLPLHHKQPKPKHPQSSRNVCPFQLIIPYEKACLLDRNKKSPSLCHCKGTSVLFVVPPLFPKSPILRY